MKKLVISGLFFLHFVLFSQNETKKWYFGAQAGLDFMTNPPTILTNGAMTTQEGCASIADAAGNLLFYTDGITIWDKTHLIMSNGSGLMGNGSTTQSGVIVKKPGNNPIYYVFTLDFGGGANGLRYSEVDMSLAAGNGSVTAKNVLLKGRSSEKLTAVKHCNGTDIWIVSHDTNSNNFRTFLVTAAGVNPLPVNSAVGTVHLNMLGNLKASVNGRKLGLAIYTTNNTFEVYDFNNATGVVSNPIILGTGYTLPYGIEFSPDGRLFYGCNATASNYGTIYQWDLCAGSNTAVIASQVTVATTPVSLGSMQLAANGKIYVARYLQSTIGVINNPNVPGLGCGYVDLAQSIAPKVCRFGLPNFVTSFLNGPPPPFTYTFNPVVSCRNASFTAPSTPTCGSQSYTVSAYGWNFGDPASGASNTSTLSNPTHSFSSSGTFTAQLILYYTCGADTLRQVITTPSPTISVVTTSVNCASLATGTVSTSGGSGSYTYSWIPAGQTGSVATGLLAGSNTVIVTGTASGCSFTTAAIVGTVNYFTLSVSGSTLACYGANTGTASISATGGIGPFTYSCNGIGQVSPTVTGLSAGIHTVSVTDSGSSCTLSQTFQIVQPAQVIPAIVASSPSVCVGSNPITFTANASGGTPGYTYSWTSGPSTSTHTVSSLIAGTYVYTVTSSDAHACVGSATVSVDFISMPFLTTSSISICPGKTGTLTASGATTFSWQPGNVSGSSFTVSPPALATYTVIGDNQGCITSATTQVYILPVPTLAFNSFSITCGSLGSATVLSSGGIGPFSYTWMPTNQTSTAVSGLFPGMYTVTVVDAGTGCLSVKTISFSPLVPLTGTVSSTPSLACHAANNATAGIALSGGSGGQSYQWIDVFGTKTTHTVNNLAAGINTVNVTDALTFCSVNHTFLVTEPPAFTLNVVATSPSVCMGSTIAFTAANSGGTPGYTYSWTVGSTTSPTLQVMETNAGAYVYTVISTDANNCSITQTIAALFVNNPTVTVSNASICPLAIGTLSALGANTYSWSNGSTGNLMFASPAADTQYTVTGTSQACTATATGSITLKPVPVADFTANAMAVCQGDSIQLTGLGTHSLYAWTGPAGFSSGLKDPLVLHSVLPGRSGNYTLKVTAPNSCTAAITKSITVHPTPLIVAAGNTVCEGSSLKFSANFIAYATYSWSGPAAFSSTLQNPPITNANTAMSGQYSLSVTSSVGCTNTAVVQASVIALPVPSISVKSTNCVGEIVAFNGSGGGTYNWFGPLGFNSALQNPTLGPAIVLQSGTYSLFVTTGSCTAVTSTVVNIYALPVPSLSCSNPNCVNSSISLISNTSAQSYTWSGPQTFINTLQNPVLTATSVGQSGNYTLSITDVNGCRGTSVIFVSVLPAPNIVVSDVTVCIGQAITLTVSGGSEYAWSGPMNYSTGSSVAVIPVVNPNTTGIYTITVTGSNSCTTTKTLMLTGMPYDLPHPSITTSAKACLNSKINLRGSGGGSYLWQGPGNFTATTQEAVLIINSPQAGGTYTLSVTNESNCVASSTIFVEIYPLPKATVNSRNNGCAPFCTGIALEPQDAFASIKSTLFYIGTKPYKDSVGIYCFDKAGSYSVSAMFTDTNNCSNTASLQINIYPKPQADFEYTPLNPLAGIDRVQIYNSTKGPGAMDWTWFLSKNDTVFIKERDPVYIFETSGMIPLVLIARNEWGCTDTAIKVIHVDDEFGLYVPNAFTPNGDGLNDIFLPKGQGINKYKLEIFDRWGEPIFYTEDFHSGWDGSYRNKPCKTDTYVWKIGVINSAGNTKSFTGKVTLLRAVIKEEE